MLNRPRATGGGFALGSSQFGTAAADEGAVDLLRTFVLVLGLVICFGLGFAFGPLGVLLALFVAMFIGFAVIER